MGHNISGKSQWSHYMEKVINRYDAKVDNKKRISIRGSKYDYYSVTEYDDGKVILEPRILVAPIKISNNTLSMMDKSVENIDKGTISEPIDLSKF